MTATAGIGTNMYLVKIALDIISKHVDDNMGCLTKKLIKRFMVSYSLTIKDIKMYVPKSNSISNSQMLFEDYHYNDAFLVLKESVPFEELSPNMLYELD